MAVEPLARVMLAFGKPDHPAVGKILQRRNQVFPDGRIVLNEIGDGCHGCPHWREGSLWRRTHARRWACRPTPCGTDTCHPPKGCRPGRSVRRQVAMRRHHPDSLRPFFLWPAARGLSVPDEAPLPCAWSTHNKVSTYDMKRWRYSVDS